MKSFLLNKDSESSMSKSKGKKNQSQSSTKKSSLVRKKRSSTTTTPLNNTKKKKNKNSSPQTILLEKVGTRKCRTIQVRMYPILCVWLFLICSWCHAIDYSMGHFTWSTRQTVTKTCRFQIHEDQQGKTKHHSTSWILCDYYLRFQIMWDIFCSTGSDLVDTQTRGIDYVSLGFQSFNQNKWNEDCTCGTSGCKQQEQ